LCQNCLRSGRAVAAKTVDHIKAKAHGGPMTIRTSKACAGPAIERKPGANALNDIDSHLM
jgi:5-methylcytosine-specific restriction protein A